MSGSLVVSIVLNNYNYGRFVGAAIDSALNQTYPHTEVIVVDDGSTDDSHNVIASYGSQIVPILKKNGGMASTYNVGFPATHGQVILILDSDDLLLPTAVASAIQHFDCQDVVNVHWPLWEIDKNAQKTGRLIPTQALSEGDFRSTVIREGPSACVCPPTSGNAWSRRFLENVLPAPELEFRQHADTYLTTLASACGLLRTVAEPLGCYRVHGANDFASLPSDERNRRNLNNYHYRCVALSRYLRSQGVTVTPETWERDNLHYEWMRKELKATEAMKRRIPSGSRFVLVDDGNWADSHGAGGVVAGRQAIPFLERDGQYWGAPPDDETAIAELERLRREGASYLFFAWPAFWWLENYKEFARHLASTYKCLIKNDALILFDLGLSRSVSRA